MAKTKGVDEKTLVEQTVASVGGQLECPEELLWHWRAFKEIAHQRGSNGYSANPISWTDLAAWASLSRVALSPFDCDVILAVDSVWMEVAHD